MLVSGMVRAARRVPRAAAFCWVTSFALAAGGQIAADRLAALEGAITAAEAALRNRDQQLAESRYQSALQQAWTLAGALATTEGRMPDAEDAFRHASTTDDTITPQPSLFAGLGPAERLEIRKRVTAALARAYLNLGIMQAQSGRFLPAAELLEEAARVDAGFPQVQYSLGVAYFNAQRYSQALAPLSRALDTDPNNATLRRMLAMSCLNTDAYDKAAALLASDPGREADPSLQYAYGLALVRSDRAADAEAIFSRLLAEHGSTPEVSVVLGHAYAQQGNFEAAVDALQRALRLNPAVADANSALGTIYLKQGRLAEAEAALRAELKAHPRDVKTRQTLATALDLLGRQDDALIELQAVLDSRPELVDAQYLLGKILLSRDAADAAAGHLEAAARLAPDDANIHYQLARAYQRLGRTELARQEFATYQQLKEKQRGKKP